MTLCAAQMRNEFFGVKSSMEILQSKEGFRNSPKNILLRILKNQFRNSEFQFSQFFLPIGRSFVIIFFYYLSHVFMLQTQLWFWNWLLDLMISRKMSKIQKHGKKQNQEQQYCLKSKTDLCYDQKGSNDLDMFTIGFLYLDYSVMKTNKVHFIYCAHARSILMSSIL